MATDNDRAVLNSIFNPFLPTTDILYQDIPKELVDEEVESESPEVADSKKLEVEGVMEAEAGRLEKALAKFTEATQKAPQRASPYNNRAQALRLKGDVEGALKDMEVGLGLCQSQGKTGCLLLCQRGVVYRAQSKDELAKADFQAAAKLGSTFAKQQLVEMNPYAAMCNQMLREMMTKLTGENTVPNGGA